MTFQTFPKIPLLTASTTKKGRDLPSLKEMSHNQEYFEGWSDRHCMENMEKTSMYTCFNLSSLITDAIITYSNTIYIIIYMFYSV